VADDRTPIVVLKRVTTEEAEGTREEAGRASSGAKGGRKVKEAHEQTSPSTPPPVPAAATRGGESGGCQRGTLTLSPNSRLVWTESMLAALARGNNSRQWHTLIDKVFAPKNLRLALETVTARRGAPGIDGQTTEEEEGTREV